MEKNKVMCHCGHLETYGQSDIHSIVTHDGLGLVDLCDKCFSKLEGKDSENESLGTIQFKDIQEQAKFIPNN